MLQRAGGLAIFALAEELLTMNTQEGTSLSRIGQIAINAHDVDRATAFYRDVLGLPHLFRAGQLSFFDCGGVRLMLDKAEKPEFRSSQLYPLFPGRRHSRDSPAPQGCRNQIRR
jgi:methylmalonyl-CoA/ethylmalonyl-CoA epimerase